MNELLRKNYHDIQKNILNPLDCLRKQNRIHSIQHYMDLFRRVKSMHRTGFSSWTTGNYCYKGYKRGKASITNRLGIKYIMTLENPEKAVSLEE